MREISNKFYLPLVTLLGIFTYLLNYFNNTAQCSLIFVFIAVIVNIIAELYGKKKAIIGSILSVIVSAGLLWNFDYYINGKIINGLVPASLLALLVSTYCGTNLFLQIKSRCSFITRNFVSLILSAVIDGIIMVGFFINKFSTERVLVIFTEEILFKCLYSAVACASIFLGSYLIKRAYKSV
jgi:hypothetical protein